MLEYFNGLPWILKVGAPVILLVLGGLIMFAGGYRGYELHQNLLENIGAVIAGIGALLFLVYMYLAVRNMGKK